ncbi:MAG: hypothetical protein K0U34_06940 [Alphaproteobacteria bacterium]|nr:hypothetical protein [Alphaproteobacteria bacterium]
MRSFICCIAMFVGWVSSPINANEAMQNSQTDGKRLSLYTATPVQAGIRYGQAAGVTLVCYGLKTTDAVDALKARFKDEDLAVFNEQSNKVLKSWVQTLNCEKSGGPNECKLSHVWSCQQALKEIGPDGTALPGLVEQKTR